MTKQQTLANGQGGAQQQPEPVEAAPVAQRQRSSPALRKAGAIASRPLVVLGVFALAYAGLGYQYFQTAQRGANLDGQIEARQATIRLPESSSVDVTSELAAWGAAREEAENSRVTALPDSEILARTLEAAEESGVAVHVQGSLPSSPVQINEITYLATPLNLRAQGEADALQLFLARIEKGTFETIELQDAMIGRQTEGYVLTIKAVVYSQPAAEAKEVTGESGVAVES